MLTKPDDRRRFAAWSMEHGLRKGGARRLAEAGATPHEIMAVTGHKTLSEVERYTRAVEQKGLAERAMKKRSESGS